MKSQHAAASIAALFGLLLCFMPFSGCGKAPADTDTITPALTATVAPTPTPELTVTVIPTPIPATPTPSLSPAPAVLNTDTETYTFLVNRDYPLPADYVPDDLVIPDVLFSFGYADIDKAKLRKVAADALEELFDAAYEEAGHTLYGVSGYRSYDRQYTLYATYLILQGVRHTNLYSAAPGTSEHQTGLAIDVSCQAVGLQLEELFAETEEGIWLANNAHRFGYIIRYPKDMEHITGYAYEPWHIRYVGNPLATYLYEENMVLDVYYGHEPIYTLEELADTPLIDTTSDRFLAIYTSYFPPEPEKPKEEPKEDSEDSTDNTKEDSADENKNEETSKDNTEEKNENESTDAEVSDSTETLPEDAETDHSANEETDQGTDASDAEVEKETNEAEKGTNQETSGTESTEEKDLEVPENESVTPEETSKEDTSESKTNEKQKELEEIFQKINAGKKDA